MDTYENTAFVHLSDERHVRVEYAHNGRVRVTLIQPTVRPEKVGEGYGELEHKIISSDEWEKERKA